MARRSNTRTKPVGSRVPELDLGDYPLTWDEYIGQPAAKRMLRIAAKSARMRKKALGHILISHPTPGVGKTALAALIAREMGTTVRVVSGKIDVKRARMLFSELKDFDILLYDEAHQMMNGGKKDAEWFINYLQDGTIPGPRGNEIQPKVTIVAATTDAGKIPDAIAGRFLIQPPMEDYDEVEGAQIAVALSRKVLVPDGLPELHPDDATAIAAAANNNPRGMRRLLTVLLDLAITEELPVVDGRYDVPGLLDELCITDDGLDLTAQQYLETLGSEFDGQAGEKALEDRLGQAGGLASIERLLMDKGYVVRTRTGRTLTRSGITRYRELVAS